MQIKHAHFLLNTIFDICQAGLRKEAWQQQRGEREGATAAQIQEGVQGRFEGDQEGLALPGQREAQRSHEQVWIKLKPEDEMNLIVSGKRLLTFSLHCVLQRCREEEEGEGALWQLGHSGGRVEGPEEEEEEVKCRISVSIVCSFFT